MASSAAPHARTAPRPMPRSLRVIVPVIVGVAFVAGWEGLVRWLAVPALCYRRRRLS